MEIEFIGHVLTQELSETVAPSGPIVQPDYLRALARAHERAGFDKVLIPHSSSSPDGFLMADQTLNATDSLGVLLAHRPGFVAPTQVARMYATLDAFHPGRIAMHVISGGDDADQARDGDWVDKAGRYRRSGEFLQIVRRDWSSADHFDHAGEFYRVQDAWSNVRPASGQIPVYFGGASADAVRVAARYADVYALWGEPRAGISERIDRIHAAAAEHNRRLRFSVSVRPIIADSEREAWAKAHELLRIARERQGAFRRHFFQSSSGPGSFQTSEGAQRLVSFADAAEVHDERLWTALAKVSGGQGNSTALVGTAEQVADSLHKYVELGVGTLLIRGYEPLEDAVAYAEIIGAVRERVATQTYVGA